MMLCYTKQDFQQMPRAVAGFKSWLKIQFSLIERKSLQCSSIGWQNKSNAHIDPRHAWRVTSYNGRLIIYISFCWNEFMRDQPGIRTDDFSLNIKEGIVRASCIGRWISIVILWSEAKIVSSYETPRRQFPSAEPCTRHSIGVNKRNFTGWLFLISQCMK